MTNKDELLLGNPTRADSERPPSTPIHLVDAVLDAAARWSEKKAELDRCNRQAYVDRGYFCSDYRHAEETAREAFGSALMTLIDARIAQHALPKEHHELGPWKVIREGGVTIAQGYECSCGVISCALGS